MATPSGRVTVFGVVTAENEEELSRRLTMLYGKQELSAKQKKKMEKLLKLQAKEQKQAAQKAVPKKEKKESGKKKKTSDEPEVKYVAPPAGEKKDCSGPLAKAYDPKVVEDAWYAWWEKQGLFQPEYIDTHPIKQAEPDSKSFTIIIPPPNVTGSLHLGHALTNAIEDTLTRWHRMRGERTLWNPGCDHAGIATQVVVEKRLARQGITRHQLGREKFVEKVWEWKENYGAKIYDQLRGLGASCDWTREAFTMSDKCSKAVTAAFIKLHEEGLIYRADRLINWSCTLKSAIADIEVDKVELTGRTMLSVPGYKEKVEFGLLTSFAYKLADADGELVIATTRPETMLGDVAIAVNPKDERYLHLHGKHAQHPFLPDRKLVIIADDMAEIGFGTGAVKITPAHDPNDYECGKRHNLPSITVIDKEGNMTENCGEFAGMPRFACRKKLVQRLKDLGLFRGEADNAMVVPVCSRSKDIVEPMRIPQWFCNCDEMARDAVQAVRTKEIRLIPDIHEKTWYHWLENIRDWCISRQLWWGHRIPAYFVRINDPSVPEGDTIDNKYWVSAETEEEALEKAAKRFNVDKSKITLKQDEDVLDTWFSSGLYPISIFGWPEQTDDMEKYFPGNLLETGHDILFFWVARMVMMCKKLTGKFPFKEVFLHSIIRDAHGRKMSKSLGNVVDPMDVRSGISLVGLHKKLEEGNLDPKEIKKAKRGQAEDYPEGIKECGVDALRFGLCAFSAAGRDINLDVNRIFGYRTFCNKIWQAVRFSKDKLGQDFAPPDKEELTGHEAAADKWILSRLAAAERVCNKALKAYDFPAATTALHSFWRDDFCDFYLELSKPIFFAEPADEKRQAAVRNTLYICCDNGLRLLSPFMPFVTEELYQFFPRRKTTTAISITVAEYPTGLPWEDESIESSFNFVKNIVHAAREAKTRYVKLSDTPPLLLRPAPSAAEQLEPFLKTIKALVKVKSVTIMAPSDAPPKESVMNTVADCDVFVDLAGLIDPEKEIKKIQSEIKKLEAALRNLQSAAEAPGFNQAPESVQLANQTKTQEVEGQLQALNAELPRFEAMRS